MNALGIECESLRQLVILKIYNMTTNVLTYKSL
jgi:hypothetical protein